MKKHPPPVILLLATGTLVIRKGITYAGKGDNLHRWNEKQQQWLRASNTKL